MDFSLEVIVYLMYGEIAFVFFFWVAKIKK